MLIAIAMADQLPRPRRPGGVDTPKASMAVPVDLSDRCAGFPSTTGDRQQDERSFVVSTCANPWRLGFYYRFYEVQNRVKCRFKTERATLRERHPCRQQQRHPRLCEGASSAPRRMSGLTRHGTYLSGCSGPVKTVGPNASCLIIDGRRTTLATLGSSKSRGSTTRQLVTRGPTRSAAYGTYALNLGSG
jgi:hypothetical protein